MFKPIYKNVSRSDVSILVSFVNRFPVSSEFLVCNIFNWNKRNSESKYCLINDLLVLEARDNLGKKFVHSVLGEDPDLKVTRKLLDSYGSLYYTPNYFVEKYKIILDRNCINIKEDRDNFDYVYEISDLRELRGSKFESKRRWISKFERTYPLAEFKLIDPKNPKDINAMRSLYSLWLKNWLKKSENSVEFIVSENDAFKRFCENTDLFNYKIFGIYLENTLVGFSVYDLVCKSSTTAVGVFAKADIEISGIYSYLNYKCACYLGDLGYQKLNHEMDLGFSGLRTSKQSWGEYSFVKKYTLTGSES